MVLPVTSANNVKVYTLSGGLGSRTIPDWIARKNKKALKKDFQYRTRVDLIQDFEFPEASNCIKTTRDGKFVVATGTYKPQMRVFEFAEVSMKFDRHTDSETVRFEMLSDDWTKAVLLQVDRYIELHAQGGIHYRTRVPHFGRDIAYHFPSCDVLVATSAQEIYRLNLEQGMFQTSIQTDATEGINCIHINPAHQMFGFGTGNGTVELWDPRSKSRVGVLSDLRVPASVVERDPLQVTALRFRDDGLTMGVGTNSGHTLLYDLRSSVPTIVKDHQYSLPIKSIAFHEGPTGSKTVVADNKIIKIWDRVSGDHFTSIEPVTNINDLCLVENSGLLFTAQEGRQMGTYYIPELGPAPRWASFLDNLTEEMEETPFKDVYDEYKFVTRKELAALSLEHLMGTNVLKPYMHGYFVDLRLYEKAKLIANPFAYDEFKEKMVREKLEKERASRIRANNKLPSVNKNLAKRLLEETKENKKKAAADVLADDRFKAMFADPDYEVEEDSKEYQLLHPSLPKAKKQSSSDEEEESDEDQIMEEDGSDEQASESDDSDRLSGDSDSEDDIVSKIRKERGLHVREKKTRQTSIRNTPTPQKKSKPKRAPEMRMGTEDGRVAKRGDANRSFASRLQSSDAQRQNQGHRVSRTAMGGMEMSFKPSGGSRGSGRRGRGRGRGRS